MLSCWSVCLWGSSCLHSRRLALRNRLISRNFYRDCRNGGGNNLAPRTNLGSRTVVFMRCPGWPPAQEQNQWLCDLHLLMSRRSNPIEIDLQTDTQNQRVFLPGLCRD